MVWRQCCPMMRTQWCFPDDDVVYPASAKTMVVVGRVIILLCILHLQSVYSCKLEFSSTSPSTRGQTGGGRGGGAEAAGPLVQ